MSGGEPGPLLVEVRRVGGEPYARRLCADGTFAVFSASTTTWDGETWSTERHEPRWREETRISAGDLADLLRAIERSGVVGEDREIADTRRTDPSTERWTIQAGGRTTVVDLTGIEAEAVPTLAPVAEALERAIARALDAEVE